MNGEATAPGKSFFAKDSNIPTDPYGLSKYEAEQGLREIAAKTEMEVAFDEVDAITVMSVDNLPCELPKDASDGFGRMFYNQVMPAFFNNDKDGILKRARVTTSEGTLTERFSYLQDYVDGSD